MAGERNRVVIPLQDRLMKAKTAIGEYEILFDAIQQAYAQRGSLSDTEVLNEIGEILHATS